MSPLGRRHRHHLKNSEAVRLEVFGDGDLELICTMWGPLVISWFIAPSNYGYNYHKP